MRYGFAGIGIIIFGMFCLMGIFYILDGTVINEENYYSLKEAMEASMYDAIDLEYYQNTGDIKISQQRFVDVFTRRFVETSNFADNSYVLEFYDIIESPPKASVVIKGVSDSFNLSIDSDEKVSYDIYNSLTGILIYDQEHLYSYDRSYIGSVNSTNNIVTLIDIPESKFIKPKELELLNCHVKQVEYSGRVNSGDDLNNFLVHYFGAGGVDKWYSDGVISSSFIDSISDGGVLKSSAVDRICNSYNIKSIGNNGVDSYSGFGLKNISFDLSPQCVGVSNVIVGVKYNITWSCNG